MASLEGEEPGVPGEWFQIALESKRTASSSATSPSTWTPTSRARRRSGSPWRPSSRAGATRTEAATALLDWAFPTFGLHRVIAITDALNSSAAALLERVGFRREAHFVENVFFKGAWGSEFSFAVLDHEWAARRS